MQGWLIDYESEITSGIFEPAALDFLTTIAHARSLIARHTANLGVRSFDVFHVAASLALSATNFITLDRRQAELARAAGLTVHI